MLKHGLGMGAKLGLVAATVGLAGAARRPVKPFVVYHDGAGLVFAPQPTGTHRIARLGPWMLGERLKPGDEKLRDKRLNLYVVVPGAQYHSPEHPEYDHNLVINKYPSDRKAREWDIFWCLQLDPSLPADPNLPKDMRSERDLLEAAHQRFHPPASFSLDEVPARAVMAERLSVTTIDGLNRFRRKDGSLPRLLIVPARLAVRATAELERASSLTDSVSK